jgi:hypothetical protein
MIPVLLASGFMVYGFIQSVIAGIALIFALQWNKFEFLPGLVFLFLYAVIEAVDLFFFAITNSVFIDVAQFGFILLSIIFFIIGMHPVYAPKLVSVMHKENIRDGPDRNESVMTLLKKF